MVDNWKKAWTWFSVQLAVFLAFLPHLWEYFPQDLKNRIPPEWYPWVISAVSLGIVVGRLKKQSDA